jgi:fatty acid desaturase
MSNRKAFLLPRLGKGPMPSYFHEIQDDIRPLLVLQPAKFFLALAINWAIILGTIGIWLYFQNYWLMPLAMFVIGARQHAMGVLLHEGAHGNIVRNRKWNNRIAKWFAAWPIGINFENYKYVHSKHHLHLNHEEDPDWMLFKAWHHLPADRAFYFKYFGKFLLGFGFYDLIKFQNYWHQTNPNARRLSGDQWMNATLLLCLVYGLYSGNWSFFLNFFLLWVAPLAMVAYPINSLRAIMEHYSFPGYTADDVRNRLKNSRSIRGNLFERFVFIPYNVGYHLEHHIYDTIPFYHLDKLSNLLKQHEEFVKDAPIFSQYFGEDGAIHDFTKKSG